MIEGTEEALLRHLEAGEFQIPPMSEIALRVTELASNPDSSAASIVELVRRDPGLTSALLRYANSAALGARVEIVSVHQAVVHLGIGSVSRVALAASLQSGVFDAPQYSSLAKSHWTRSAATALAAGRIARVLAQNVEVAFLCGLLWEVGAMLALRAIGEVGMGPHLPDEEEADGIALDMNDRFREAAVEAWNLPDVVSQALSANAQSADSTVDASIATLACALAPLLMLDTGVAIDIDALVAQPAAERLNLYPEQIERLVGEGEGFRAELEAMP